MFGLIYFGRLTLNLMEVLEFDLTLWISFDCGLKIFGVDNVSRWLISTFVLSLLCFRLGKTIQIIAFLSGLFDMDKVQTVMIVLPVSVMVNWEKEFNKW